MEEAGEFVFGYESPEVESGNRIGGALRITPSIKLVFLKYMQLNNELIQKPESCPKLMEQMCAELTKEAGDPSPRTWGSIMKQWVKLIKDNYRELKSEKRSNGWTTEDIDLANLIDASLITQGPTKTQLSCILDHLEVAPSSDDPRVWTTIALEMEALGAQSHSDEHWQKCFEKWANKVKRKKEILEGMNLYQSGKKNFLTALECRLICFLETSESTNDVKKEASLCRVCLTETGKCLRYIHDSYCESEDTIAKKISEFANIEEISQSDGFPQFICESCFSLFESACKFKEICEQSEYQLRNFDKSVKGELIDYIIETMEVQEEQEEQINEQSNNENVDAAFESDEHVLVDVIYQEESEEECVVPEDGVKEESEEVVDKPIIHQCDSCGIVCYNQASLKKHINSHLIARPHQCSVCSKEFKTKLSLKIHMRSHTGERPYVCEVCGKAFTQDSSLQYHRAIHTGEKKHTCNKCDYRARNGNDLKIHMRKHTGVRPYLCGICPARFSTSSNRQKHRRRHTGDKNFKTCGKAFKTWSAVSNHRAIHSAVKTFECPLCPYKGSTKANLQIHNRTHTGIQPYACSSCNLKFSTASNRRKHIKNVHQKLKVHKCTSCDRSFFSRESARKHMVIHTGLKPYNCLQCPMTYGWYNGLQKHMKTQHPDAKIPGEKYYIDKMEK